MTTEPLRTTQRSLQHTTMLQVLACWCEFTFAFRYGAARAKVSPFQDWWATQAEPFPRARHNHMTRDIKPEGVCPSCDLYHRSQRAGN